MEVQRSPKQVAQLKGVQAGNVGRRHVPETKAKMRTAWEKTRTNRVGDKHPMWGKHHSAKTRAKLRAAGLGKHLSPKHKANISASLKGPRHPSWRGGISREPYAWTFNAELKEEVRRRDGYQCQLCGVPQMECKKKLAVHHVDYDKRNSDPVNLAALCNACHTKVNANRKHWTAFFQAKAIRRSIEQKP